MKKLKTALLLLVILWSIKTTAQEYEFYKEISGFANDSRNFQYYSGLAKITIDAFDNIYILDGEGRSVIKLDSNKKFVKKWYSSDYTDNEEVKKQNSDRFWFSMFDFSTGIKTDFEGNVYVFGYGKIHKFDTNGTYLTTISTAGEYQDIAFDSQGNIYAVTETSIEKLNSKGELLRSFVPKTTNQEQEETNILISIALDSENNVYVLDRGLRKVLKFNNKGKHIDSFCKAGQGDGEISDAQSLAIDKHNTIYICDNTNTIQCLDSKGRFKYRIGRDSAALNKINYPHAIALDSKGHIYIQCIYNGIIEYDENKKYVATLGTDGREDGCLIAPDDIFISKDNFLYIVDEKKPTIQKYTLDGTFIEVFLKTMALNGVPYRIEDIGEDEDGHIVLLTEMHDNPLVFVTKEGYYHMKYTSQNQEQFLQGKSLAIKRDSRNAYSENYFVSTYNSGYIKKLNSNGFVLSKFTSIDTSNARLAVSDFMLDSAGNVIVGFSGHSIQKFDKNGVFIEYVVKYDTSVSINRSFQTLAMDSKGNTYTLNDDCEALVFNSSGTLISNVKLKGKMSPCLNTQEKIGVSANGEFIFVTDKMNYRVQIFKRKK